jgi:glycosyltransferase involved in cell wall biosynthesis
MTKKRRLVISAVNCVEGGILSILQDCVASVCKQYAGEWDVFVLANRKSLLPESAAHVFEFPNAKKSWLARLVYEFILFRRLSKTIEPDVWVSLHDISANVIAKRKVVYCHNPNPFYPLHLRDALSNWKLAAFSLFYGRLYGLNIHSNDYVVVQQDWLRREFQHRYGLANVIVAHPEGAGWPVDDIRSAPAPGVAPRFRFFYPFVPRFFKNTEVVCNAARIVHNRGHRDFEVVLTLDGTENAYAKRIRQTYGDLPNITFAGRLARERVFDYYRSSDCLIFASRLETWGLPITEFKATGRPMLLADVPYAHETVGSYENVAFFDADNEVQLAEFMVATLSGTFRPPTHPAPPPIASPYAANWSELWALILES